MAGGQRIVIQGELHYEIRPNGDIVGTIYSYGGNDIYYEPFITVEQLEDYALKYALTVKHPEKKE
jgi:hypothetical protein